MEKEKRRLFTYKQLATGLFVVLAIDLLAWVGLTYMQQDLINRQRETINIQNKLIDDKNEQIDAWWNKYNESQKKLNEQHKNEGEF